MIFLSGADDASKIETRKKVKGWMPHASDVPGAAKTPSIAPAKLRARMPHFMLNADGLAGLLDR